jgi:uncharacterized protein YndB with AHSA1/START domain
MPTLETAPTAADNILLEQTRIIRASRARVYEAWTNPEIFKQWFGPANMHCPSATLDVRVGGAYRVDVHPNPDAPPPTSESAHREAAAAGTYTKVVPNELLQFTWDPSWNPGEHSLVTVLLKDVAGGTEIVIRHEKFLTESSRDGHNQGWTGCLDKLATQLQS